jgi:predicted dehydrogenase/nucleoside-diphosphate-sugar epimerase
MNPATVRVGLVGAGYVANHHARALRDLPFVELVAVCDQDEVKAAALAKKFGVRGVFRDLASMRDAQPHVIHILTPPQFHCALAIQAMEMGCHVFVEKPMAETPEECDRMMAKAAETGRVLSVNHSDRFDPVVLQAIDIARSGACGDILAVHSIRSSDYPPYAGGPLPAPYRQGSYPFRDLGVHSLYLLESFLGPVQSLQEKHYSTGRDPMLTFDEWRVHGEFENGTGYMYLSWNTRPAQSELMIHGTRGVIRVDRFLQTCEVTRTLPGPKQIGIIISGFKNAVGRSWRVPLNLIRFITGSLKPSPGIYKGVQDFHRALAANAEPPVAAVEGKHVISWVASASEAADREKQALLDAELTRPLAPARVLITGGAGFLGSALVDRLAASKEPVRLLLRRPLPSGKYGDHVSAIYGSLGQPDLVDRAVQGVDIVYHVGAAMKGPKEEFEQGTVWGTRNIIDACLRHKVKRLVYVSSMSVLDHAGHRPGDPVTESSGCEPFPQNRGAYTQTKLVAEQLVLDAIKQRGLPAVILRPGQIFGPGAERVTPNGVIGIAGQWIVAGAGRRKLPLVYRDDVVDAILAAAQSERAVGSLINVVDTADVDQNEYLRNCAPFLKGAKIRRVPVWFLMFAAMGVELLGKILKRDVPLSRYRIRSLMPLHPFDVSRAKDLLGWSPAVGVKQGLLRTFGKERR